MTSRADFSIANAARALRASLKVPGKWEVAIEANGTIVIREAADMLNPDSTDFVEEVQESIQDFTGRLTPSEIPDDSDTRVCSVYFIKCMDAVKIGISKHVKSRAADIQVGQSCKVEILHTVEGGRALEKHFHKLFSKSHIRGEWFKYDGDVRVWLESRSV